MENADDLPRPYRRPAAADRFGRLRSDTFDGALAAKLYAGIYRGKVLTVASK